MMQLFSTKYNTYLGQPKSIHDWVFFWSHYICGYWKVYYSVYHSQPLESCCQSKRKPWEMFSHQQETTYNICKSWKFIFSRGFCSDNIILPCPVFFYYFYFYFLWTVYSWKKGWARKMYEEQTATWTVCSCQVMIN